MPPSMNRNLKSSLIFFLILFAVIFLTNIFTINKWIVSNDPSFWQSLSVIGTFIAISIALYSISESNKRAEKQLEIEQTPYLVAYGLIEKENPILCIKNIGRGMARNVQVVKIDKEKDNVLTCDEDSTYDMGQNETLKIPIDKFDLEVCSNHYRDNKFDFYFRYFSILNNKEHLIKVETELVRTPNITNEPFYKILKNIDQTSV